VAISFSSAGAGSRDGRASEYVCHLECLSSFEPVDKGDEIWLMPVFMRRLGPLFSAKGSPQSEQEPHKYSCARRHSRDDIRLARDTSQAHARAGRDRNGSPRAPASAGRDRTASARAGRDRNAIRSIKTPCRRASRSLEAASSTEVETARASESARRALQ
jgi:hypothetical protein